MDSEELDTMKHVFLIVACFISMAVIFAVVFGWFPLIPINADAERVDKINAFAVDASLGVLTSILFYYLLVYIGERKRAKDMRKLIQGKLNLTAYVMEIIIAYYVDKCNVTLKDKRLKGLSKEDFKHAGGIKDDEIDFYFHCPPGSGCSLLSGSTELGFLKEYCEKAEIFCGQILESPGFAIEETKLITLISNIKKNALIREVNLLYANKGVPVGRANVCDKLYAFYQLYLQLLNYATVDEIEVRGELPAGSVAMVYT